MAISFGSNADQTCYVLYFVGVNVEHCDCGAAAETMCGAANIQGRPEQIRLVSVPRSTGVTVASSRAFLKFLGFNGMPQSNNTLQATVQSSAVGSIRVSTNPVGVPSVCSVSGAYGSITKCLP